MDKYKLIGIAIFAIAIIDMVLLNLVVLPKIESKSKADTLKTATNFTVMIMIAVAAYLFLKGGEVFG